MGMKRINYGHRECYEEYGQRWLEEEANRDEVDGICGDELSPPNDGWRGWRRGAG